MASVVPLSKNSDIINTIDDEKFAEIFTTDEKAVQLTNNRQKISMFGNSTTQPSTCAE